MKLALQRCCTTPVFLRQYESSTNAVLERLGVSLVDVKGFNCCGYPLKNLDLKSYLLASARNLSLAEAAGLNIMTLCNCCYSSLKHANKYLHKNSSLSTEVNSLLSKENLCFQDNVNISHVLQIFYREVGLDALRKEVVKRFRGLKIATHYGCHLLRPSDVVQFDNPWRPHIFDELVELTGAESISWPSNLECCGAPMKGIDDALSVYLTKNKLKNARKAGSHFVCVSCPYCQLQFDRVQRMILSENGGGPPLPSILYTQLLGLSIGIDPEVLGLRENELDATGVLKFLW